MAGDQKKDVTAKTSNDRAVWSSAEFPGEHKTACLGADSGLIETHRCGYH